MRKKRAPGVAGVAAGHRAAAWHTQLSVVATVFHACATWGRRAVPGPEQSVTLVYQEETLEDVRVEAQMRVTWKLCGRQAWPLSVPGGTFHAKLGGRAGRRREKRQGSAFPRSLAPTRWGLGTDPRAQRVGAEASGKARARRPGTLRAQSPLLRATGSARPGLGPRGSRALGEAEPRQSRPSHGGPAHTARRAGPAWGSARSPLARPSRPPGAPRPHLDPRGWARPARSRLEGRGEGGAGAGQGAGRRRSSCDGPSRAAECGEATPRPAGGRGRQASANGCARCGRGTACARDYKSQNAPR